MAKQLMIRIDIPDLDHGIELIREPLVGRESDDGEQPSSDFPWSKEGLKRR